MSSGSATMVDATASRGAATPAPRGLAALGIVAGLLLAVVIAAQFGAVSVTAADWSPAWLSGSDARATGSAHVLWQIRLPRALFALLIGGALGVSGALTQGLFRNPLADPGLLGITGGAACAAALTIVVLASTNLALPIAWRPWLLPAAAFVGALTVCFSLDAVARWLTPGSITGLLLTGVALNALAAAVIGLCTYLASDEQLRSLSFWTLGSLAGAGWWLVAVIAALLGVGAWRASRLARSLNALALGEAAAGHCDEYCARHRAPPCSGHDHATRRAARGDRRRAPRPRPVPAAHVSDAAARAGHRGRRDAARAR